MRSLLRQGVARLAPAGSLLNAELERLPTLSSVHASLVWLWTNDHPSVVFPEGYKFMLREDLIPWIVFALSFVGLILFDNLVLHRNDEKLTFNKACLFTLFWLSTAALFCFYIFCTRGSQDAFDWATGYLLEWMLSVDNLFVFRSIFMVFRTPDAQKHKPLFWGIVGAVIFRMAFFVVEEFLVHTFSWMYVILGVFLIYTGVKVIFVDDEEANPRESPLYNRIIEYIPYNDKYSKKARFCDWVPRVPPVTRETTPPPANVSPRGHRPPLNSARSDGVLSFASTDEEDNAPRETRYRLVATRLTLVVICLEVTDIVFAVDSVSAIVAQIPDLFLAYTACVFAMLGLRATFFVVDELVSLFTLLPYAVGGILVLLGAKLIMRRWVHIPPPVVCVTLFSMIFFSIIGSIVYDRFQGKTGFEACCEAITDCNGRDSKEEDGDVLGVDMEAKNVGGSHNGSRRGSLASVPEEPEGAGSSSLSTGLSALRDEKTGAGPVAVDDESVSKQAVAAGGDA